MGKSNKQLVIFKKTNRQTSLSQAKKKEEIEPSVNKKNVCVSSDTEETNYRAAPHSTPHSTHGDLKGTGSVWRKQRRQK